MELTKEIVWILEDLRSVADERGRTLGAEEVLESELIPQDWSYRSEGGHFVLTAIDGDVEVAYDSRQDVGEWLGDRRTAELGS